MVQLTKIELQWIIAELRREVAENRRILNSESQILKGLLDLHTENLHSVAEKLQKVLDSNAKLIQIL